MTRDARRVAPVSVVVPTYNGARYLAATIRSALEQSVVPAEIIVVDDGSSDGSADLAASLGATVIRQQNGGICAARNTGILAATQPWIALLDHDDSWLPNKLETQLDAAERFPDAVLIATDCVKITNEGEVIDASFAERPEVHYERLTVSERHGDVVLHGDAANELALTGWFLMPSASLVRRDALVASGMFDTRTPRYEDTCCFLRLLMHGPLVFIRQPLTRWVIHGTNSHGDTLAMLRGHLALEAIMRAESATFPATYRARMARERPDMLLEAARIEIDRGQIGSAWSRLLAASLRGRVKRALVLLLLSLAPAPLRTRAVSLSRSLDRRRGVQPPASATEPAASSS
jgi:GT2 family glycosyltransferase